MTSDGYGLRNGPSGSTLQIDTLTEKKMKCLFVFFYNVIYRDLVHHHNIAPATSNHSELFGYIFLFVYVKR